MRVPDKFLVIASVAFFASQMNEGEGYRLTRSPIQVQEKAHLWLDGKTNKMVADVTEVTGVDWPAHVPQGSKSARVRRDENFASTDLNYKKKALFHYKKGLERQVKSMMIAPKKQKKYLPPCLVKDDMTEDDVDKEMEEEEKAWLKWLMNNPIMKDVVQFCIQYVAHIM